MQCNAMQSIKSIGSPDYLPTQDVRMGTHEPIPSKVVRKSLEVRDAHPCVINTPSSRFATPDIFIKCHINQ